MKFKTIVPKLLIALIPIILLIGCGNQEIETLNENITSSKNNLSDIQSKNDKLEDEVNKLNNELKSQKYQVNILNRYKEEAAKLKEQNTELLKENRSLKDDLFTVGFSYNERLKELEYYRNILQDNKEQLKDTKIPQYIFNVYDPVFIEVGDERAGLVVKKKDVGTFKNYNIGVFENIMFEGNFTLEGKLGRDEETDKLFITVNKSEFKNIPIDFRYMEFNDITMIISNSEEMLKALGKKYKDGVNITATFTEYHYRGKIESEKWIEIKFVKFE